MESHETTGTPSGAAMDAAPAAAVPVATPRRAFTTADLAGAAAAVPTEQVDTAEWAPGTEVTVRAMTGRDRSEIESRTAVYQECLRTAATGKDFEERVVTDPLAVFKRAPNLHVEIALRCTVRGPQDMAPLFGVEDRGALEAAHAAPLVRIYEAVHRLSRTRKEDKAALEKNSGATPGAASS